MNPRAKNQWLSALVALALGFAIMSTLLILSSCACGDNPCKPIDCGPNNVYCPANNIK